MIDRETIVVDCNSQYGRCNAVNKLQYKLDRIKHILTFNQKELNECLCNPIDEEIMKIIAE